MAEVPGVSASSFPDETGDGAGRGGGGGGGGDGGGGRQYNPLSKYEEKVEIDGLTLYEIHQSPRKPKVDQEFKIPLRKLNIELECPICLQILHETTVVKECMHRFCSECIQKCLRVGKNECPSCRINVPSRRSLFLDKNYDKIINMIYPDLEAFEASEEKYIAEVNAKVHMNNAFTAAAETAMAQQHEERRKRKRRKENPTSAPSKTSAAATATRGAAAAAPPRKAKASRNAEASSSRQASFILLKHPQEDCLPGLDGGSFLTTSEQLNVQHIRKYILMKLGRKIYNDGNNPLVQASDIEIFLMGHRRSLPSGNTIDCLYKLYYMDDRSKVMILYYRLKSAVAATFKLRGNGKGVDAALGQPMPANAVSS